MSQFIQSVQFSEHEPDGNRANGKRACFSQSVSSVSQFSFPDRNLTGIEQMAKGHVSASQSVKPVSQSTCPGMYLKGIEQLTKGNVPVCQSFMYIRLVLKTGT